jgi:hypothetical protein
MTFVCFHMNTFAKISITFGFATLFPLLLLLIALQLTPLNRNQVKTQLAKTTLYSYITTQLHNRILSQIPSLPVTATAQLKNTLNETTTRKHVEQFIDESAAWLNDETTRLPTLSFQDTSQELQKFSQELTPEQRKALETYQIPSESNLDLSQPPITFANELNMIKKGYQIYQKALPILIGVISIMLLFHIFSLMRLSHTTNVRLRWLGIMCVMTALIGILPVLWLTNMSMTDIAPYLVGYDTEISKITLEVMAKVLEPLMATNMYLQQMTMIIMLVLGSICLIFGLLLPTPKLPQTTQSHTFPTDSPTDVPRKIHE